MLGRAVSAGSLQRLTISRRRRAWVWVAPRAGRRFLEAPHDGRSSLMENDLSRSTRCDGQDWGGVYGGCTEILLRGWW